MVFYSLSELVLIIIFGLVSIPTPLSVPPLPEDPGLLRAAPRETIAYVSWFGRAQANPKSQNATEKLAAEPEVRAFFRKLLGALGATFVREMGRGEEQEELAQKFWDLGHLTLDRPGCFFISSVDLPPKRPSFSGGLVVNVGKQGPLVVPTLRKLEVMVIEEMLRSGGQGRWVQPLQGVRFRLLPEDRDTPQIAWGLVDEYVVVAFGEGMPKKIVEGLRGARGMQDHPLYREAQGKIRIARPCFRSFLDLSQVLQMAQETGGREIMVMLGALGLDKLRAVVSETGLEGESFVSRSVLTATEQKGLLQLLSGRPLTAEDLALIPGDATLASVLRIDPAELYEQFISFLAMMNPRGPEEFRKEVLAGLEEATGVSVERDLLPQLGDTLSLWSSPRQGGLVITGLTVAFSLKDRKAFGTAYDKMMAAAMDWAPKKEHGRRGRIKRGVYLEEMNYQGVRIHFINTVGDDMPLAPAVCLTDRHLMISLFPQMLKENIRRAKSGLPQEGSLAMHPKVKIQEREGVVLINVFDARRAFGVLYPLLFPLGQLGAAELQREGLDLDISVLPTASSILPHLTTEITTLQSTKDGLLLTRQGSIPVMDPVLGMGVPLLATVPMYFAQMQAMQAMRAAQAARMRALEEAKKAKEKAKKEQEKKKDGG